MPKQPDALDFGSVKPKRESALPVKAEVQVKANAIQQSSPEISDLLRLAVERDISVEKLERLVTLYERVADRTAASAFATAKAGFQAKCRSIERKSTGKVATKSGVSFRWRYAELDAIAEVVNPLLSEVGLSYSWDKKKPTEGDPECVCKLEHIQGHSETAAYPILVDPRGTMSRTQEFNKALTYAKRQSLIMVLGLTMCDEDQDGTVTSQEKISEEQVRQINDLIIDVDADREKFKSFMGVKALSDITIGDYNKAVHALQAKGKAKRDHS